MTAPADLADRLALLERRVADLESRAGSPGDTPEPQRDAFWALTRLEHEYPEGAVAFAGHVQLPSGERWRWKEIGLARNLLEAGWEDTASALAALGHPLRLAILRAVMHGKRTTTDLQADPALAVGGKLYHHLRDLQAGGWLTVQKRGQYMVPADRVIPLLVILMASGGLARE